MSFARPDTGRRREPLSPGRRFGASTRSTAPAAWLNPLVALATGTLLSLAAAAPALAGDDEGPIMLSNEDVARLHAQEAQAAKALPPARAAKATVTAPAEATTDPAELEAHRALEAQLRQKLDVVSRNSMGQVSRTLDARILEEEAVTVPDGTPPVSAPASIAPPAGADDADGEPTARLKRAEPEPACVYNARGRLLHEPEGRSCAAIRVSGPSRHFSTESTVRARSDREQRVGCVYGSRGQLLYSSPGVECAG